MYDIEAMERLVKQCDANIKTFEKIIDDEVEKKREYQNILRNLETIAITPER